MQQASVESRRVTVRATDGRAGTDEADVRYFVAGEGAPVVLLHGIGLDSARVSWRYALPALADDFRVYAPDLPGHGASDKPDVRYTTDYFRDVLAGFLDELGLAAPRLVGISMGGGIALGHALDHGAERLVLVDSYGLGGDAPWRPAASVLLRMPFAHRRWWASVGASKESVRAHLDQLVAGDPPGDLVADVYEAVQDADVGRAVESWQRSEFRSTGLETNYAGRLGDLDVSTMLVHGTEDPLLPATWSERAVERLPDAELRLFERCGHWPPRENRERFERELRRFLGA